MLMRLCFMLMIVLSSSFVFCQGTLVADYRLDNCSADDFVGPHHGFILGTPCACGVRADGFRMNGTSDYVEFSPSLNPIFAGDFSISFYARFDPQSSSPMDLFSLATKCASDSVLLMRYIPDFKQLRLTMSSSVDNTFSLNGVIESPECWTYIVFTKLGAVGSLYVNDELVSQSASISNLRLMNDAVFSLANSPCSQSFSDVRFRGDIDEIKIYEGALTERQIQALNLKPDQIITNDTTIFTGQSAVIETGGTCSADFVWTPADGLSSDMDINPIATPTRPTTTYTLTVNNGRCTVTDDVTINVIDRDVITCGDLLLPSAFTPNGDGVNDDYGISNVFLVEQLISFEVFDRWGGRVFGTRDINVKWNGNQNNGAQPLGNTIYVYQVEYMCNGDAYTKTGTVSLIR